MTEDPSSAALLPEEPPPESTDLVRQGRSRAKRRALLVTAGVLTAAAAGLVLFFRAQDAEDRREASIAWGKLSRCLVGPDLAPDERASLRLRTAQIHGMSLSDKELTSPGTDRPWPAACGSLGHAFHEKLKVAGMAESGDAGLAAAVERLAKKLGEGNPLFSDLAEHVDAVFDRARVEKVEAVMAPEGPSPPLAGKAPFNADALAAREPLSRAVFTLKGAHTDAHPAGALRVLVEEKGVPNSPFLCTFAPKDASARCRKLPGSLAEGHGLRLYGTADDDSAPLVFAGERGTAGIFRADTGERIDAMYAYGGYAKKDGTAAALGYDGKNHDLLLVRRPPGAKASRTEISPDFNVGNFYYSTQILWDQLLLRGVTRDNARRLFAAEYAVAGAPVGAFADAGELPEPGLIDGGADEPPHIAGCRTPESMVVRVKGYDNDFMSFRIGGKWSAPMSPEITGGVLSCHGTEAVVTRLEPAPPDQSTKTSITQCHCTSAGCRRNVVVMGKLMENRYELAPREGKVDAADLDGKLLVVWIAGERGGVRMRLAPPEQMTQAKDVVVYDDLIKDGRVQNLPTIFDLRVFSRDGFAIVLLNASSGVHALRVTSDGTVSPMSVTWES
jgi:hypothetical protein